MQLLIYIVVLGGENPEESQNKQNFLNEEHLLYVFEALSGSVAISKPPNLLWIICKVPYNNMNQDAITRREDNR